MIKVGKYRIGLDVGGHAITARLEEEVDMRVAWCAADKVKGIWVDRLLIGNVGFMFRNPRMQANGLHKVIC